MIITGTIIRTAIIDAIKDYLDPVPVYSIMPPDTVNKYVILEDLAQNQIDNKSEYITQGFINISCVEKFIGRDGDYDQVNAIAMIIRDILTPDLLARFAFVGGINIFTMNIDSVTEGMFENPDGRTAICTLRLQYKAQYNN
jgi:hypothetical protein